MDKDEKIGVGVEACPAATATVPTISPVRLHTIIAGLWICLFLSALDTTIVTTALIKISNDFNSLGQAAWLITAYLLTYNCEFSQKRDDVPC